ncbi:hypothetical protein PV327_011457, partial [Microctonus hyperodae]
VLASIDAPQLASDVLDVHCVSSKNNQRSTGVSTSSPKSRSSLIVKFKSNLIAKHIINKKRRKGLLKIKDVFNIDTQGNVYVNEFLTSSTHSLYRKTKELAKACKWKYVWIMDGHIYIRKNDGSDNINIFSDADLQA